MKELKIKQMALGQMATNCYIIENGNQSLIVDPGAESEKIIHNEEFAGTKDLLCTYSYDFCYFIVVLIYNMFARMRTYIIINVTTTIF